MLIEIGQGERLVEDVPIISAFYGIVIRMFYHELKSSRARRRIRQWAKEHRAHLQANWEKMKAGQTLEAIEPLVENKP